MSKKYVIGIDIGGTHTDMVLVDEAQQIIKAFKTATTSPLELGVKTGLEMLFQDGAVDKAAVSGIFVGTTHATNAIVEQKDLYRVGVIRIAGHRPTSLRPCYAWPKSLVTSIFAGCETIGGGFECDSRVITPFCPKEAKDAVRRLVAAGAESLAVVGVFSPISPQHELLCAEAAREVAGDSFPLSLSYRIGSIGFIERENAAILNAALKKPMEQGFRNLESIRDAVGLTCPLYITQNDGSLINLDEAIANPLLTVSSGPTNSFIGASKLAGVSDAVIVDVGGTTTDIGVIRNGYPRRSMHNATIGGVSLNFRMPDVMVVGLGGGSYLTPTAAGQYAVGPESCGKKLMLEAQAFGGNTLTLSDAAFLLDYLDLPNGNKRHVKLNVGDAQEIMTHIFDKVQNGISVMKGKMMGLPVVYVGGGAPIASQRTAGVPYHYSVANAFGAALAEISGTVDTIVSLQDREQVLGGIKEQACAAAVAKGAHSGHVRIVDVQVIPYHYIPGQLARVVVTASGPKT